MEVTCNTLVRIICMFVMLKDMFCSKCTSWLHLVMACKHALSVWRAEYFPACPTPEAAALRLHMSGRIGLQSGEITTPWPSSCGLIEQSDEHVFICSSIFSRVTPHPSTSTPPTMFVLQTWVMPQITMLIEERCAVKIRFHLVQCIIWSYIIRDQESCRIQSCSPPTHHHGQHCGCSRDIHIPGNHHLSGPEVGQSHWLYHEKGPAEAVLGRIRDVEYGHSEYVLYNY